MTRRKTASRYTLTHYPHPLTGTRDGADVWGPDYGTWVVQGIDAAADRYTAEIVACRCATPKCRGWHAARIRKLATAAVRAVTETRGPLTPWAGHLLPHIAQWTPTGPAWAHDATLPLPDPARVLGATIDAAAELALWLADPGTDPAQRDALMRVRHIDDLHEKIANAAAGLAHRYNQAVAAQADARAIRDRTFHLWRSTSSVWGSGGKRKANAYMLQKAETERDTAEKIFTDRTAELIEARGQLVDFAARRREHAARAFAIAA